MGSINKPGLKSSHAPGLMAEPGANPDTPPGADQGGGDGSSSLNRASEQQRKFIQPVLLHVFQKRGKNSTGQGNPVPVMGDSKGRLVLLSQLACKEIVGRATLSTADTFICQASSDIDDIVIWINNKTGTQLNLTLNHRRQAEATAVGNALITTSPIVPNFFGPLPGLMPGMIGMKGKMSGNGGDILSGISSTDGGIIVTVYGRRVQS